MLKKKYYVDGMHCPSCEILVEKELGSVSGVCSVKASLKDNQVELTTRNTNLSLVKLNKALSEYGYVLHAEKISTQSITKKDVLKVLVVLTLFIAIFYVLEQVGRKFGVTLTSSSSAFTYFIFGIMAGISSCAALVGGILITLASQWNSVYETNKKVNSTPYIYFNAARLVAFAVFGGILGYIGSAISISITASSYLTLATAVVMIVTGIQMLNLKQLSNFRFRTPKAFAKFLTNENNFKGKYMPLAVGALTFFIPCGFTLIAQTNALTTGSARDGALMMFSFALGTLPVLWIISASSIKLHANAKFSRQFNLFSGLLILFFAIYTINSQLNVLGLPSLTDIKIGSQDKNPARDTQVIGDYQLMQIEAIGFEYFPKVINIKAGIKTKMEVYNESAVGCAQALYAKGLYPDVIYLAKGLNTVEFTPTKKGTYKITCSMGMVPPITVYVR